MQKRRWSLNYAYDFVKVRKQDVSPNFNFMGQLLDFEKQLGLNEQQQQPEEMQGGNNAVTSMFTETTSPRADAPPTLFFTTPKSPLKPR